MVWEVLDYGGYVVQYINVQMFSNLGGDFEDSISKLSLVILLSLLQLIRHVFSKLFQIVVSLTKCETENQNKMKIIGPSKAKLENPGEQSFWVDRTICRLWRISTVKTFSDIVVRFSWISLKSQRKFHEFIVVLFISVVRQLNSSSFVLRDNCVNN